MNRPPGCSSPTTLKSQNKSQNDAFSVNVETITSGKGDVHLRFVMADLGF